MISLRTVLFAGLLFLQPVVTASNAWVAEPAAGATVTAVYVTIANPTMYDIYVDTASSDVAEKVEFREKGAPVKSLTVPSYGELEMKAGESSLLLTGLKRALKAGDRIELKLQTDGGINLTVTAEIRKP
jgi:copper(I)-binding protein